eukprot:3278313-Rhodomonas_salina.1
MGGVCVCVFLRVAPELTALEWRGRSLRGSREGHVIGRALGGSRDGHTSTSPCVSIINLNSWELVGERVGVPGTPGMWTVAPIPRSQQKSSVLHCHRGVAYLTPGGLNFF